MTSTKINRTISRREHLDGTSSPIWE